MSDTEEKDLAPSQQKLRKARERGQVASSSDLVSVVVLIAGLVGLSVAWPKFAAIVTNAFRVGVDGTHREVGVAASRALATMLSDLLNAMLPILIMTALAGLGANIAHKRGIVFSIDPIKPDFSRLNPMQGFKKLFSVRSASEFAISLARIIVWFVAAGLSVWYALPAIITSATCGISCSWQTGYNLTERLGMIALVMLIILALADIPLQFSLFRRDMKMSRTEMKREMKDMEGSPEFQGLRKRTHQEMLSAGGGGARAASVVIVSSSHAVALFYDGKDAPVPLVVAKGTNAAYERIMDAARTGKITVHADPQLAHNLYERTMIGNPIPPTTYDSVAVALLKAGLIK